MFGLNLVARSTCHPSLLSRLWQSLPSVFSPPLPPVPCSPNFTVYGYPLSVLSPAGLQSWCCLFVVRLAQPPNPTPSPTCCWVTRWKWRTHPPYILSPLWFDSVIGFPTSPVHLLPCLGNSIPLRPNHSIASSHLSFSFTLLGDQVSTVRLLHPSIYFPMLVLPALSFRNAPPASLPPPPPPWISPSNTRVATWQLL